MKNPSYPTCGPHSRAYWRAIALSLAAAAGTGGQARAQDGAVRLDEIVVSAQKREESLQAVPISITAFSADQLIASGVTRSMDLAMATPGLFFGEAGRDGQVFIRGVGSTRLTGSGTDPSSSTYVDGVYRSRPFNSLLSLLDIERVEVLRGPQGTLYGRNSTGGAIRYISSDPTSEFSGRVLAEVGDYDYQKILGQLDVPLAADKLLVRIAGLKARHDGYTRNLSRPGETFGRQNELGGRLTLKYIGESFELVTHAGASDDDSDQTALKHYVDPNGFFASAQVVGDPRRVYTDYYPRTAPVKNQYWDMTMSWDLGWSRLTSISGYNKSEAGPYSGDLDSTEIPGANDGTNHSRNGYFDDGRMYSQELMLASQGDGRSTWLGGLYYLDDRNFTKSGLSVALFNLPFVQYYATGKTKAYAAFGDLKYRLTDALRLDLGLRYSNEKKNMERSRHINGVLATGPQLDARSWDAWTYKVGLDYFLNQDAMLYASVSRGFKSGAFNAGSFEPAVSPEFLDAYEVGAKTTIADGRVRLNGAVFYYDYQDLQVQALNPAVPGQEILRNAAGARIKGGEVEISALVSTNLKIDVGLSVLDAKYTSFLTLDDSTNASVDLRGNYLPNSPKVTTNLGVGYTIPLGEAGNIDLHADYFHSAEKYFNENNSRVNALQPAYNLLNARVSYAPTGGNWSVAAYGKNLTDELVFSRTIISRVLLGTGYLAYLTPPRTYGVALEVRF